MKTNYTTVIINIIFITLFACLGYFSYLLFYTPPYFDTKQPFKLDKKEYHIGEILTYTSDYCKYREYVPVKIERNLVDGFVYPLPNVSTGGNSLQTFPVGCRVIEVDVPLLVPMRVPTGQKYHIEIIIEYKINPLQNEIRTFKTEEFTLLPALPIK